LTRPPVGPRRRTVAAALVVATALALLAGCSSSDGGGGGEATTDTTIDADLPKGTGRVVFCKQEAGDGGAPTAEVERLVENLISQASLADAEPYDAFQLVCDNTGVTSLEAPTAYAGVEPAPLGTPQAAIRVSPDFSTRIEEEPVVSFFAAPVGGAQFPTQPGFGTIIQQSADGSLSSGTRDPREGETIAAECQALPIRDLVTADYTGKAQFFVNCGNDQRAWVLVAAAPANGDPYFLQVVAQVLATADAEALGRLLTTMQVDKDALARFAAATAPVPDPGATTTTAAPAPATTTAAP